MLFKLVLIFSSFYTLGLAQNCQKDGIFPTADCTGYITCHLTNTPLAQQFHSLCPVGLLFDIKSSACNWPSLVKCNNNHDVVVIIPTPKPETIYLITQYEFDSAFYLNGYPVTNLIQYQILVSRASQAGIFTKLHMAIFLTQLIVESNGLRSLREINCYPILNLDCDYFTGVGYYGQNYYGRGYIQLSWDYNYREASLSLFGSDTLLANPDQVATNDAIAWATTFWFWKNKVLGSQYGYLIMNGLFGASTNAINGPLECEGVFQIKAKQRFEIYKKVLIAFNINSIPDERGCYN